MALDAHCHKNTSGLGSYSNLERALAQSTSQSAVFDCRDAVVMGDGEMNQPDGSERKMNDEEPQEERMLVRAQRFPIHAALFYRTLGERDWYSGTVENISSSGVMFHGEHRLEIGSVIEVHISLSGVIASQRAGRIAGRGRIVRLLQCESDSSCTLMAAALTSSRILRSERRSGPAFDHDVPQRFSARDEILAQTTCESIAS